MVRLGVLGAKFVMFRGAGSARSRFLVDRASLLDLKKRALRAGVWFRALSRLDRAFLDLTIKVADVVRSSFLAGRLLEVLDKLAGFLESKFSRALREVGFPLAKRLSLIARGWGYAAAESWDGDVLFARFLAVMHLNNPAAFHV